MTSLSAAKILFFLAMSLHPHGGSTILATSSQDNYLWTQGDGGWTLQTKTLPGCDWVTRGEQQAPFSEEETNAIAHHNWSHHSFLNLKNGNRVEKRGDAIFYIIDPGAPNQKTYTILFPQDS